MSDNAGDIKVRKDSPSDLLTTVIKWLKKTEGRRVQAQAQGASVIVPDLAAEETGAVEGHLEGQSFV